MAPPAVCPQCNVGAPCQHTPVEVSIRAKVQSTFITYLHMPGQKYPLWGAVGPVVLAHSKAAIVNITAVTGLSPGHHHLLHYSSLITAPHISSLSTAVLSIKGKYAQKGHFQIPHV